MFKLIWNNFKINVLKSKISKIPNSEENSKRTVSKQMPKSKAQTHLTNGWQLTYSWLGTAIFLRRKLLNKPGFIAS